MKVISTPPPLPTLVRRTRLKITEAGEVVIGSEVGQELARHRVLLGRRELSVQAEQYRGLGTPAPRVEPAMAKQESQAADPSRFWDAPVVEVRPLTVYDQLRMARYHHE
jgi:hypothetical protein